MAGPGGPGLALLQPHNCFFMPLEQLSLNLVFVSVEPLPVQSLQQSDGPIRPAAPMGPAETPTQSPASVSSVAPGRHYNENKESAWEVRQGGGHRDSADCCAAEGTAVAAVVRVKSA
ncbi:hypothetical protein NDU88_005422 [Pleurodeles waltl]|uniref:Uncharacterized protein n=1 Tax=Pleurodeles waltl TaxID=8319 RepID=A0AAV7WV60_PLEWA|nr:hypothetical protein NDU88_005422 [Pleurodeles waltl]